ncbi:MAG TPA: FAD-dependent oxidoreductase [Magnetospirillaceae bacterium]|jgi:fumarate reductase flavoprotein subunit
MAVLPAENVTFPASVPIAVIGGGACGLVAALAASDAGGEVIVFERDAIPSGSTALSSGLIPAAGTRFQRDAGIDDSPRRFEADIQAKAKNRADPAIAQSVAQTIGPTIEWLAEKHHLPFTVVTGFLYPGHSCERMHAHPERTGRALIDGLRAAVERAGIDIVTGALVADLYARADGTVAGLAIERPDGTKDTIGCEALVLACSGFGGNSTLVRRYIPEMGSALYFGHTGNRGDALSWGEALGAATRDLTAYQGHGSVAHPHGILISWALTTEGGFQVNIHGRRFSDESGGYSEQSVVVLNQPGGTAWNIYDERLHQFGLDFPDYRDAVAASAVRRAGSALELAAVTGLPADALMAAFEQVAACQRGVRDDEFGRDFSTKPPLIAPFYAIKVTGALFHTQGGLVIDTAARVLKSDGTPLPNLFAGGGAACGVSGPTVDGYLSGNGLLTAVALGRWAGESAAKLCKGPL